MCVFRSLGVNKSLERLANSYQKDSRKKIKKFSSPKKGSGQGPKYWKFFKKFWKANKKILKVTKFQNSTRIIQRTTNNFVKTWSNQPPPPPA